MTTPSPAGLSPLLDQLDEARAKGTPGEWHVARGGGIDAGDYDTVIGRGDVDCMAHCYGGTSTLDGDNLAADLALIVAEHNAVPLLTAAIRGVLELHARRESYGDVDCIGCRGECLYCESEHEWPCPTVAALTAALTPGADTAGATA